MLTTTIFLGFLLLQTLSVSAAGPLLMERDFNLAAVGAEDGQPGRRDIGYEKSDDYNPFKDDDLKHHNYNPFKDHKDHKDHKCDDPETTTITITDQIPGPTMTITVTIDIEPTTCTTTVPFPTDCTTETATVTVPPVTETDTITITEVPGSVTLTETEIITNTDTITQSVTATQTITETTTSTTTSCPTESPTGGPDTGDCTPPTITFYPDRDPNQAFEIDNTEDYPQNPSALISTQMSFICNRLESPCNAPASTVQYCRAAAQAVDSSGLQGAAQAEFWNSFWT